MKPLRTTNTRRTPRLLPRRRMAWQGFAQAFWLVAAVHAFE
ncbi:hypothetical protein [uncultured Alistipes sp.]|nr:hypothetical protein [uncultured Alistipes sp.]